VTAAQTREWDWHCTCRCGYCATHDHEHCINPAHAAAFRQQRELDEYCRSLEEAQ